MKRLLSLVLLALMLASISGSVVAQDATPAASPAASAGMLAGLGYDVLNVSTDGTTITAPTEVKAGRYLLDIENTSGIDDASFSFYGPRDGKTVEELSADFAAADLNAGPPDWYFQIDMIGGSSGSPVVIEIPAGEWLLGAMFFAEDSASFASQVVTVTGEMPSYPAVDGQVDVTLVDMAIDMPDTVTAGPHVWQVTNTGAMPHFLWIMNPGGPVTQEDAINGIKLFYEMSDATPAAAGSIQDPSTWTDVGGSDTLTNGITSLIGLDLEPGTYIAFCFVEGPGDLGSHALNGMTKVFTVE